MNPILLIILISIIGPIVGSMIGVFRMPSDKFMFNMLSFAAGTMIAISFLNLIPESIKMSSTIVCIAGIIFGAAIMLLVDKVIPHIHPEFCTPEHGFQKFSLKKTSLYLFIGIFIHNFPEGLAMGIGSVTNFKLSFAIALAITIHDIPESICTSAPYYKLNNNRVKSFLVSITTIIPTLAGFFFAHYLFQYIPLAVVGFLIGATSGLMIYIASDELIPSSCCKHTGHATIFSLILGVILVILINML